MCMHVCLHTVIMMYSEVFYVCVYRLIKFYFFNTLHTEVYELYGNALASPGA